MMDAFRRSSAARITAVIPYYGYARQDRKDKPRVPISAKLVANLVVAAGADRVLTMDLHKAQIQAFFDIPTDHLFAAPVIIDYLSRQQFGKVTIVSPDAGGAERARAYAKRLGADLGDHRQAAQLGDGLGRSHERDRRHRGPHLRHAGRHHRHRRHHREGGPGAARSRAPNGSSRVPCTACCRGRPSTASTPSPIERLIVTNTIPHDGERARCARRCTCSRWRACSGRRSAAFTRRRRSRRCSCSSGSSRHEEASNETSWQPLSKQSSANRAARTKPVACASPARFPRSSTAAPTAPSPRLGRPQAALAHPALGLRRQHADRARRRRRRARRRCWSRSSCSTRSSTRCCTPTSIAAMDKAITVTVSIIAQGRGRRASSSRAASRLPRPRGRDRVPARRHSGAPRCRRQRADDRPGRPSAGAGRGREWTPVSDPDTMIVHVVPPRPKKSAAGSRGGDARPSPKSSRRASRTRRTQDEGQEVAARPPGAGEQDGVMKLIVGLGNPGRALPRDASTTSASTSSTSWRGATAWRSRRRRPTRWWRGCGTSDDGVLLVKPLTFMNLSGRRGRRAAALLPDRAGGRAGRRRRRGAAGGAVAGAAERVGGRATTA